jgi:hypothetical protein
MADGRFVLVYHEDLIANFPDVWDNDRLLATWLRLLALADKLWPTPAELPRAVSTASVKALADAGLIALLPKHRFVVRGLDAVRKRRKDAASTAANHRWGNANGNAVSNANGNAKTMPTRPDHIKTRPDQSSANGSKTLETFDKDAYVEEVANITKRRLGVAN